MRYRVTKVRRRQGGKWLVTRTGPGMWGDAYVSEHGTWREAYNAARILATSNSFGYR